MPYLTSQLRSSIEPHYHRGEIHSGIQENKLGLDRKVHFQQFFAYIFLQCWKKMQKQMLQ